MRLLIRGGLVIDTETSTVLPHTDVLVDDGVITAVGTELRAEDAEVVDATDRIVLPGFVDTHRHVWQTALRGIATDVDLGGYLDLVLGRHGSRHEPEHVAIATLAGALECLDSGITTVQDFAHIQHTPAHTDAAVAGLRAAGIRAVFGYGAPLFAPAMADDAWAAELGRVRAEHVGGLVTMALAAAGPSYSSPATVRRDWRLAAELDVPIATHIGASPTAARPIDLLRSLNLLRANTLYVHGNSLADDELAMIADSGAAMSIAPAVEALMGHGAPTVNRLRSASVRTGLGVDVVTSTAGDMFSLMRATLLTSQLGPGPASTAADVLRMATVDGAAALGLADRTGSLRPGRQADIVLLDATAPNLVGMHDPVATVVISAHPGNVDTVLVAGEVVKRAGRLLRSDLAEITEEITRTAGFFAASR